MALSLIVPCESGASSCGTITRLTHAVPTEEETKAQREAERDARALLIGSALLIFGTLVWAYGDLIGGPPP